MDPAATAPLSRWLRAHSYRLRLLVALLLTLLLVLGLVMRIGLDLVDRSVEERIGRQVRQLGPLFSAALAIPLAQRDYTTLGEVLRDIVADPEIEYAALRDGAGRIVAAQHWPAGDPLPPAMSAFNLSRDARYDLVTPIRLGSREVGRLHYGLSLVEAQARRQTLVDQVLAAGAVGLALAVFLSVFFAFGMTRRLARLVAASRRLAEGRLDTRTGDGSSDEIGEVGRALDAMAHGLQEKMRELADSRAQLARVIAGSSDGFWDWDLETNTTHFSARFRELLGYDDEAEFRNAFFFKGALHEEDREHAVAAQVRAIKEGAPFDATYRLRCRDGGYRWFRGRGLATRNAAGRIVRFSGTLTDVHAQKLAEAEIRALNETLEQRVAERTAELTAINRELESFSYSVSHDLTAPLRAIDGYALMLEEDFAAQIGASGKGYLARIRAGSQRMHQIIDGMLALSRVTRNEMRRETVDLSAIAEQIINDLKQMQPERNVAVRIALDIHVEGDPNLLRMAMENLLRNAWKFTARRARATIEFGVLHEADKAVYFVSDDGAGFDMQYAGKLFGAFQRLHGAQEFEGTGIGLAIVQRIIQRHGGRIWAEAAPEKGARFYFTLS